VNPLAKIAISVPVVSVMLRVPGVAVGSMLSTAIAFVPELMVSGDANAIPAPKLAVVVP